MKQKFPKLEPKTPQVINGLFPETFENLE